MELDYKIIKKYHETDVYSVLIDVTNKKQPDIVVHIDLTYDIDATNLRVDLSKGDPTYVDYGSTSVLYDDGTDLEGLDASDGVVKFYDFLVCEEDWDPMYIDETWDKQLYDSVRSETAELLGGTVEELKEAIYKINEEVIKLVIKDIEDYYRNNYDRIPDSVFECDGPDSDDWYGNYWD